MIDVGGVALVVHQRAEAEQLGAHGGVQEIGRAGAPEVVQRFLQRLTGEQDGGAFPEAGVGGGRMVDAACSTAYNAAGSSVRGAGETSSSFVNSIHPILNKHRESLQDFPPKYDFIN